MATNALEGYFVTNLQVKKDLWKQLKIESAKSERPLWLLVEDALRLFLGQ